MKKITSLIAIFVLAISMSWAQSPADIKVPFDEQTRVGKLENGLTYYIRHNEKPENRVEMRLAVNAGSVLESDEQQGLAHFVEHMCFNGTSHFEKNELVNVLERMGMKFGGDLNAYTSFDQTVYMLKVPTDNPGLIDTAIIILEDWANNLTMSDEEIDKERGVISEEWRLGLGANDRMRKQYFPIMLNGSKYADRLPIGKIDVIQNHEYETLRSFYRDWYRPELQSVVIVGDIDVDQMETKIKEHFSYMKNPENAPERVEFDIDNNDEPLVALATDKEASYTLLQVMTKLPSKDIENLVDYREDMMAGLYNQMINDRFTEITQKADAPFMYGGSNYGGFLSRAKDALSFMAVPKANMIEKSLEVVITERERAKRHGFGYSELERAKVNLLASLEKQANEADKTPSDRIADAFVYHYLENEPVPGAKIEYMLAQQLLPTIGVDELNGFTKQWFIDNNMTILITAPEREDVVVPSKEQLLAVVEKTKAMKVDAYEDKSNDAPLLAVELKGGKVIETKVNEEFEYTEIVLSNGVHAILKPTEFQNDEIKMNSFAFGGNSVFEDEEVMNFNYLDGIIGSNGIGEFDAISLDKKLSGKVVRVNPSVNKYSSSINGSVAPKDLETMLQLTYLYFTSPRQDDEAFASFVSKMENQFKFMAANPRMQFNKKLVELMYNNDPRIVMLPTEEQFAEIKQERVLEMYKELFANAADFKFVFVGNFEMDKMIPMLEKYLGSLPANESKSEYKNRLRLIQDGITEETVFAGQEHQSTVGIYMSGDFDWNAKERLQMAMLKNVLSIKLRESMREDQGGVYGVGSRINVNSTPVPNYAITVSWGCDPDRVDELVETVFTQMNFIINDGPTDDEINKTREALIRQREADMKENKWWLNKLEDVYYQDEQLISFDEFKSSVENVSAKDLKKMAKKYFTLDNYVKVVLRPESEKK